MAINVKAFDELEELTELSGDEKVLVSDGGVAKRMPADMVKGVTSWNDLTDKPFGEEVGENVVIETMTVETAGYEYEISGIGYEFPFEPGVKCKVVFDGESYICEWTGASDDMALGNTAIYDQAAEDTGEPFVFWYEPGVAPTITTKESGEHTFSVSVIEATITPIDEKYLPESVKGGVTYIDVYNDNFDGGSSEYRCDMTFDEVSAMVHSSSNVAVRMYSRNEEGDTFDTLSGSILPLFSKSFSAPEVFLFSALATTGNGDGTVRFQSVAFAQMAGNAPIVENIILTGTLETQ